MKKIIILVLSMVMMFAFASCGKDDSDYLNENEETVASNTQTTTEWIEEDYGVSHLVEMKIKNYGVIKLELYEDAAPITVANFVSLVEDKFYDGLTFHRIIEGFMIQGGDPQGTGMGGSKKTIKGEFSSNGVNNTINHTKGVISMARSQMPDSASSQFFIMHKDSPHLNGQYAAFGRVIEGIEVVDDIATTAKVQDNNGTVNKADQPVIEYVKIVK